MSACVALVEPYSSGRYLAEEFFRRGVRCIAVKLTTDPPPAYGPIPLAACYEAELDYQGLGDAIVGELKARGVGAVIAGCESGVLLADELAARLGLPHNLPPLSRARRDKYRMQQRIAECGLRSIRQHRVRGADEAVRAARRIGYPVIVKPPESGGSDSVFKCTDDAEVRTRFRQAFRARNAMGVINDCLLVQEYLAGTEYIVDAVSCAGAHYTSNVCKYVKESANGSDVVYRETSYVEHSAAVTRTLTEYNDRVLDALGIVVGPSHSEIVITADGPVLIEVGARMCGGNGPKVIQTIADHSQIDLTADAYLDPKGFARATEKPYRYKLHAKFHYVVNRTPGLVTAVNRDAVERALGTLSEATWHIEPGQEIARTLDLYTCPVWFVLAGDDPEAIAADQEKLLEMETNGSLYQVAPRATSRHGECFLILEPMNHMWLVVEAAKRKGYRTVVLHNEPLFATPPYDVGFDSIDEFIEIDDWFDHDAVVETIAWRLGGRAIAGTYAAAEYTLEAEARVRERLGLPGTGSDTLRLILNKMKLREFLYQRGLTRVQAFDPEAGAAPERWRNGKHYYLKPRKGSGSALVKRVSSRTELERTLIDWRGKDAVHIENLRRYIDSGDDFYLEEAIEGKLISVESLVNNGEITILGLTSRTLLSADHAIEMGCCFPFRPDNEEAIREYVKAIHEAIGYRHGASHLELKLGPDGAFDYVEFNARFAGADVLLAINTAFDTEIQDYLVDLSVNRLHRYPDTGRVRRFASLQYLLAPGSIDVIDTIEIPQDQVVMTKLSLAPGEKLRATRNQIDHLGGFMVAADSYPGVLRKARGVRQAIKINGVSIRDDANNSVIAY